MVFKPTRGDAPLRVGTGIALVPDIPGSTVSADVYRDPTRFELERERVLRSSWMIAGRSSEASGTGDWLLYEGHGETVIVSRQADGSLAAFHNVCQHRGTRLSRGETSGCTRRFTCPWHGWVYDTTGAVVGVPEREDFAPEHLAGLRSPAVAVDEWGGWIWINLAGPDAAPALLDWIGPDIVTDLGRFGMEHMIVHEKWVTDIPVNYKAIVDGFNEVYHSTELHNVPAEFTKAARGTTFHLSGPNSMMFVPRAEHLEKLAASGDHHQYTICHYVVFPNTVFNNNPRHIQMFQPIPLSVDQTRFICWELIYPPDGAAADGSVADGAAAVTDPEYDEYLAATMAHWEVLKGVVGEDLFVFNELSGTRHSMGYTRNVFSTRECKPVEYHTTMDLAIQGRPVMDRWLDHPSEGRPS